MSKILISGNDPDFILKASTVLKDNLKAEIVTAKSGTEAVEMVQAESPDLVVINADLPMPDGLAVCRRLKDDQETKYIPVLLIGHSNSDGENRRQAVELGADDYLVKPSEEEFLAHVTALLRIGRNYGELRLAASNMQQAEREKFLFLPEISHELRSPLNSILGFVELIISEHYGPINSSQRQYLSIIDRSGRRLLGLADDISLLAKLETGKLQVSSDSFSLPNLVEDVWLNLQIKAQDKSIDFECSIPPEIDQVNGDRRLLSMILENLLDNAIKFNHFGGKITLCCKRESGSQAGRKIIMRLSDTGKGISPEDRSKLFSPFPRIKKQNGEQGTGLGLVICKKIIDLLGGTIKLETEVGVGTTLEISLVL